MTNHINDDISNTDIIRLHTRGQQINVDIGNSLPFISAEWMTTQIFVDINQS
jgi:hypothetical protein